MPGSQAERFILTRELGRLAKWLRILGYDAIYFDSDNVSTLIIKSLRENRIILTRNSKLTRHKGAGIILLSSDFLGKQLKELTRQLKLKPEKEAMFSRCVICNELLKVLEKQKAEGKVPPYVFETQEDFVTCPKCGRIYWQGTHWGNVRHYLKNIESGSA